MADDVFTLARAQRILPLLPALYAAAEAKDAAKLVEVANTIYDADRDAMGYFEEKAQSRGG